MLVGGIHEISSAFGFVHTPNSKGIFTTDISEETAFSVGKKFRICDVQKVESDQCKSIFTSENPGPAHFSFGRPSVNGSSHLTFNLSHRSTIGQRATKRYI